MWDAQPTRARHIDAAAAGGLWHYELNALSAVSSPHFGEWVIKLSVILSALCTYSAEMVASS